MAAAVTTPANAPICHTLLVMMRFMVGQSVSLSVSQSVSHGLID